MQSLGQSCVSGWKSIRDIWRVELLFNVCRSAPIIFCLIELRWAQIFLTLISFTTWKHCFILVLVHILMRFILFFVPNVCRLVQLIIFVLNLREIIRSLTFARFKTIIALSLNCCDLLRFRLLRWRSLANVVEVYVLFAQVGWFLVTPVISSCSYELWLINSTLRWIFSRWCIRLIHILLVFYFFKITHIKHMSHQNWYRRLFPFSLCWHQFLLPLNTFDWFLKFLLFLLTFPWKRRFLELVSNLILKWTNTHSMPVNRASAQRPLLDTLMITLLASFSAWYLLTKHS